MPALISIAVALLVLVLLFFVFTVYAYRRAFYSAPRSEDYTAYYTLPKDASYDEMRVRLERIREAMRSAPYEEVTVTSHDGLRLVGRYYENQKGAPLFLAFHGYRGDPINDGGGIFGMTRERGYNLLAVYQRAHGASDGSTITFGVLESHDVSSWVAYAIERFGADIKIFLTGISMGAATVLTASADSMPSSVVGIFADCSYTSPRDILRKTVGNMHLPIDLSYLALRCGARLYGGFSPEARSPIDSVRRATLPICFIHGEADDFVPFSMVHELYDACASSKMLFTVPGAIHGMSYLVDPEGYERVVEAFMKDCLSHTREQAKETML